MNYEKEYEFLKKEADDNKRYVFERPLLITASLPLLLTLTNSIFYWFIIPLIVFLLIFNFWFTVNRLNSFARIIAYIQVYIEKNQNYIGWENYLRKYRSKMKDKEFTDRIKIDEEFISDDFTFYGGIWKFNFFLLLICLISALLLYYNFNSDSSNNINPVIIIASLSASIVEILIGFIFLFTKRVSRQNKIPEKEHAIAELLLKEPNLMEVISKYDRGQ